MEFPGGDALHRDIGIVFIETVQPSHLSIDKAVTVRVCVPGARSRASNATA